MPLAELLNALDYTQYPQYYLKTDAQHSPDIAPLFCTARDAGVDGIYVFQSSPKDTNILSVRPAVYVAEASSAADARIIHHRLWNLGQAPFLIVVLPTHIRVYTGFDYSYTSESIGFIIETELDVERIRDELADFCAEAINSGILWQKRANVLKPDRRVDKRLLKNLDTLGEYLRDIEKVESGSAHALIGKYVYIRYLLDRGILSDAWLQKHNIKLDTALGRDATIAGLRLLVDALDEQLNGHIFPLNLSQDQGLTDRVISRVASVFNGDQIVSMDIMQRSLGDLNFKVYDFEYIPIEMLSSIYEQFLHAEGKGKAEGAYYTREFLADYLIAEMNSIIPLTKDLRILDPSCGSGIFLVLVYRRLIEKELEGLTTRKLPLKILLNILSNLYGVERELDACYVTEFSLVLTLLNYVDINDLFSSYKMLPALHNTHIFHSDFFDNELPLWKQSRKFDWIIGNPPWITITDKDEKEGLIRSWTIEHNQERPVSRSTSEAFSWHVLDLLNEDGYAGLILPAKSLYNHNSFIYRQRFFQTCEVTRITNFSNLRHVLFEGRATAPAVTLIYRNAVDEREKQPIAHYSLFAINQTSIMNGKLWTITINEDEFQTVSSTEAEHGNAETWKLAQWGTYRDKRAIARLRKLFPTTLGHLCQKNKNNEWHLHEGSQLRFCYTFPCSGLRHVPFVEGKRQLNTDLMNASNHRFLVPSTALEIISPEESFIRIQGGSKGLLVSEPPHLVMSASWKYTVYSDEYFVIKPRQIGLSVRQKDAEHLQALSMYLSSSIVRYYLFFQTPSFGVERDRITLSDVKSIPVPDLTFSQVKDLAALQQELVLREEKGSLGLIQEYLDSEVAHILNIPESIQILAMEFTQVRMKLLENSTDSKVIEPPSKDHLLAYAQQLRTDLDGFITSGKTHNRVTVDTRSDKLICCTVELLESDQPLQIVFEEENIQKNNDAFARLQSELNKDFSQWIYVQRGLRIFERTRIHIYKVRRLINWTRTQAMNDADDIIAEILSSARDI